MRRERPHPGAQLTLFDTAEGFRHTCFITNTEGRDIAALELRHRGHARVEDRIRNWKDCGLANLPFDSVVRNKAWVATSLVAGALLAWSPDGLLRRRTGQGRAEDHALPGPARGRIARAQVPETHPPVGQHLAVGGRPRQRLRQTPGGHPLTTWVPTPDPKADLQGVTSTDRMTRSRRFTPTMRSNRQGRSPLPTRRRRCREPGAGKMIEAR